MLRLTHMLPKYPHFVPLELSHKKIVDKIGVNFEPYSDFDFISLFCWNTDGSTEISDLNGNIAIKLPDYVSGDPIFSLLGENKIDDSIEKLIALKSEIELVPEPVVMAIKDRSRFSVVEDIDQYDYVYALEDHAFLRGKKFKGKRKKMARFTRRFGSNASVHKINFQDSGDLKHLKEVFFEWATEKNKTQEETRQENIVLDRFVKYSEIFNLMGLYLTVQNKVVGFSIIEISHHNYAVYHFQKVLPSVNDADLYLTTQTSRQLLEMGCKYINWEQDLGIESLRQTKINHKPIKMLKKYKVQRTLL